MLPRLAPRQHSHLSSWKTLGLLLATLCGGVATLADEGPDDATRDPSISDDGRFVAFDTRATNLYSPPTDTPLGFENVFWMDRQTRRIYNAQFAGQKEYQGGALFPQMSNDGEWVTFQTSNSFIEDKPASTTQIAVSAVRSRTVGVAPPPRFRIISRNAAGDMGNKVSNYPSISADGRFIAFMSTATNLTSDVVNGTHSQIFRRDRDADENGIFDEDDPGATATVLVSKGSEGGGDGHSRWPTISADGSTILFPHQASNLPGSTAVWVNGALSATNGGRRGLSPEGTLTLSTTRVYAAGNTANVGTYYRYRTGGTETFGFPDSAAGYMSSSGARYILTTTTAQIAPADTNSVRDVYLIDRTNKVTTLISAGVGGPSDDVSGPTTENDAYLDISRDGRFLAFATRATNLGFDDNNEDSHDVIIVDRQTGERDRVEADTTPPTWSDLTLIVENLTHNSATLSWAPATDRGGISHYVVRAVGEDTSLGPAETTSIVLTGLKPKTRYRLQVEAYDPAGNLALGPIKSFDTPAQGSKFSSTAFVASILPSEILTNGLGGVLSLSISKKGAVSGQLRIGSKKISFRGTLDVQTENTAIIEVIIARPGQTPLDLQLELTDDLLAGTLTGGGESVEVSGWRQTWHAKKNPLAGDRVGRANALIALDSGVGDSDVPQGTGFVALTVAKSGQIRWAGKAADGQKLAGSTVIGPDGQVAFWQPLYGKTGTLSLLGTLEEDGVLTGTGAWVKQPQSNARERLYASGFGTGANGPVTLKLIGARWTSDLDLPLTSPNLWLQIEGAGVEQSATALPVLSLTVDGNKRVQIPANDATFSVKIAPQTGIAQGKFTLVDENPEKPQKTLKRVVKFSAIFVPELDNDLAGAGFFTVPQLANPPATTGKTSPILSGKISLWTTPPAAP